MTPMTTPNAERTGQAAHYCTLDTYPAELKNGLDRRTEDVTEICNLAPGTGETLCYAVPDKAKLITSIFNIHDALVGTLELAVERIESANARFAAKGKLGYRTDDIRAALAAAKEGQQ